MADIILLVIIGCFGIFGLAFGLVQTLGSLIGTVVGVYLASRFYEQLAAWLAGVTGWTGNFPKVLMFIIAFVIINRLVGFLFFVIDKLFGIITRLPFIKGINRLLGLAFGILEGIIVLGIVLYIINKLPLNQGLMNALAGSKIAAGCIYIASILWPLIPQALQALQDTFNNLTR